MDRIVAMREERARLWTQAEDIMARSEFTAQDAEQYDRIIAEIDRLKGEIDRAERHERMRETLGAVNRDPAILPGGETRAAAADNDAEYRDAFASYVRGGLIAMTPEQRQVMTEVQRRALYTTSNAAGGYLIPQDFANQIVETRKFYADIRNYATVIETEGGNALPIPTNDSTSAKGSILADNGTAEMSESDPAFGQVQLDAYTYTSGIVRVSLPLMQDNAFDLEAWLAGKLGERLGRIETEHFTTGTGSNQPQGIVTGSAAGATAAAAAAVAYDDLINLIYSVDRAYRAAGAFMMADSSIKAVRKLKDANDLPLWQPSVQAGEPDRLLGYPVIVNNEMAAIGASAKSMLFGDFRAYWIRDVLGVQMVRFDETYMKALQIGFAAYIRTDAVLTDDDAVKHLVHPAM